MRKRRFLFVGGSSDPGGLHIHTADVAQALAALGHEVGIVSVDRDFFTGLVQPGLVTVEQAKELNAQDLLQRPEKARLRRAARWASILARHRRADIVLCRGAFAETPIVELLMARAAPRRLYTIEHRPRERAWPRSPSKRSYGAVMNRCVRRVIAVSSELAEIARRDFGIAPEKIAVCLNWVDPQFHPATAERRMSARAALRLDEDVPAIGYLGRLGPEKRVDVLIGAFRDHLASRPQSNAVLIVAGDGWYRDRVEAEAAASGVGERIRFAGWQTDPRDILDALDLFVLPSLVEGFPLSLIEAMASGLAVVAHPMSSTLDLIDNGRNGIVTDISTAHLLSTELTRLLDAGPAGRSRLGEAAALTIAETYSRDRRLPAVLAALDVVPDGGAVPAPVARPLPYWPG